MAQPEIHQIANTALTAHAFNGDRSRASGLPTEALTRQEVALCANTSDVEIIDTRSWKPVVTLGEHDKLVCVRTGVHMV